MTMPKTRDDNEAEEKEEGDAEEQEEEDADGKDSKAVLVSPASSRRTFAPTASGESWFVGFDEDCKAQNVNLPRQKKTHTTNSNYNSDSTLSRHSWLSITHTHTLLLCQFGNCLGLVMYGFLIRETSL